MLKHNSLLIHQLHVVVHGVGVVRHRQTQVAEITHTISSMVVIDDVPVEHEHDNIELEEDLGGGLVDRGDHSAARGGQSVQKLHQVERSCRVESSGGLVQED